MVAALLAKYLETAHIICHVYIELLHMQPRTILTSLEGHFGLD